MGDSDPDWLNELHWRGAPLLAPARDYSAVSADVPAAAPPANSGGDARGAELGRENEALRARLAALLKLASEFERRLADAGTAHDVAMMQAESRLRQAAFDCERLAGELQASKSEAANLIARDAAREADLRLERERRADSERALHDARRRLTELSEEAERLRAAAAEQSGALQELRRQASDQSERFLQSKAFTDQDIQLLRQELREFLARLHRLQDVSGEMP